jgi:hypothetical protein
MFKRFSGAIAARRMLLERCLPLKDIEELKYLLCIRSSSIGGHPLSC